MVPGLNPDDDAPALNPVGGLEVAGGMVDVDGGKLFENPGEGKDAKEAPDEDGGGYEMGAIELLETPPCCRCCSPAQV